MCGIVGYIGPNNAVDIVMTGLRRLEYRGYDSAGVAVVRDGVLAFAKSPGKLSALDAKLKQSPLEGSPGIGHTRWATHGRPTEPNAHPHLDDATAIAVVHNGIIENHQKLREKLTASGVNFRSETDSEVLAHLIRSHYDGNLCAAVREALTEVSGAYAIAVISSLEPEVLVAARQGSPLIIGVGDGEMFVASDVPAIMDRTRNVVYLDNGQVCELKRDSFIVMDLAGNTLATETQAVDWDEEAAEKDGYAHFMLKEIHQQPDVIRHVLEGRVDAGSGAVQLEGLDDDVLRARDRIAIVACGTAWHAALVGKRLIESFVRIPVEVDIASEFRYRDPIITPNTLLIPVTQSGETADTLEATRIAKQRGAKVIAVVNVTGSSITRESDGVIYTKAGPEIGVASTKAYTSQLVALALFTVYLSRLRNTMDENTAAEWVAALRALPEKVQACLDNDGAIRALAEKAKYRDPRSAFFMGRGYNYPSALEGALKLKEISYIHAEGYGAGEMKHGPLALITDEVPMIGIATRGEVYDKIASNIQEIRARNGIVLTIATEGDTQAAQHSDDVIYVPDCFEPLSPVVIAVPLQLFAYYIAVNRGCDVDQPRNLAKSVTVE